MQQILIDLNGISQGTCNRMTDLGVKVPLLVVILIMIEIIP